MLDGSAWLSKTYKIYSGMRKWACSEASQQKKTQAPPEGPSSSTWKEGHCCCSVQTSTGVLRLTRAYTGAGPQEHWLQIKTNWPPNCSLPCHSPLQNTSLANHKVDPAVGIMLLTCSPPPHKSDNHPRIDPEAPGP